jgi:hypothetical protein
MFPFSALLLVRSVAEIQSVCFVNIEFRECKKLILKPVPIVCPNCPNQLNVNRQYPIRAHCSIVTVAMLMKVCGKTTLDIYFPYIFLAA